MTKFLLLLFAIFALAIIGLTYIFKKVRGFFSMFSPPSDRTGKAARRTEDAEVVYDQDDVVVLKGEAGKKKNDDSKNRKNI
jgi:hypothetical protein